MKELCCHMLKCMEITGGPGDTPAEEDRRRAIVHDLSIPDPDRTRAPADWSCTEGVQPPATKSKGLVLRA